LSRVITGDESWIYGYDPETKPQSFQWESPNSLKKTKLNFMVWVRERTIPTERPPLVGEVIANLCG
jgi:hypothetical protein